MICYFCNHLLSKFIDVENTGNYDKHYVCYNCPTIHNPAYGFYIWRVPYIIDNRQYSVNAFDSYLYFHNIEIYLSILRASNFMDLKNKAGKHLFRVKEILNEFDYHPSELENKIKTWITFS